MKFIDLFSGIGGFRTALEKSGHECLAFAEIDKFARQSYKALYNTDNEEEWHDVTAITDEEFRKYRGVCDIIVGGFPCQAFSVAGRRRGFEDTRGTLFFEVARAIKEIQPSYALLENVKGLFSHEKGRTFGTIIQALDELGYVVEWGLFNSKYWGVPQNRERVYILVTRKNVFQSPKLFNLIKQQMVVDKRLAEILEKEVDEHYYIDNEKTKKLTKDLLKENDDIKLNMLGNVAGNKTTFGGNPEIGRVYDFNGLSPTLNTMQGGGREPKVAIPVLTPERVNKRQNGRRFKTNGEPSFTLTSQDKHGIYDGYRIRKLTPLECWRLQGFSDEQFYKAKNSGVSNSQLYKQAGNSVTVNVVRVIVRVLA